MLKKDARKLYREKRNALSPAEKEKLDDLLLIRFQALGLPFLHHVLSYMPKEESNEPDTRLFTEYLEFKNPSLQIAYPKTHPETGTLSAVLVHADTAFLEGAYGIPEPQSDEWMITEDIDLVIVPLLICDREGYRVGYGKGYYDRFLRHCHPGCIKVGFMYFEPVLEISDKDEFDVPLNLCITPHNLYVF